MEKIKQRIKELVIDYECASKEQNEGVCRELENELDSLNSILDELEES